MSAIDILTSQAPQHQDLIVRLKGHIQAVRDIGNLVFLVLRDRVGTIQLIAEGAQLITLARQATLEGPVLVEGTIRPQANVSGKYEVRLASLKQLSKSGATLPVEIGKQTKVDNLLLPTMLDYRPLTLRNEKIRALFKIESAICAAFQRFLCQEGFTEIRSPKIVSTGTESGAQLFQLEYFGKKAYLAQSPQFYKQIMVGVFERVFEIGPVYRAELHDTTRHLNEYISMDVEMGFIEGEQDLLSLETHLLRSILEEIKDTCVRELSLYEVSLPQIKSIPQITFEEAVVLAERLKRCPSNMWQSQEKAPACKDNSLAEDLDPEAERLICEYLLKTEGSDLVFIVHYPLTTRPFYTMPLNEGPPEEHILSRSFDLLFRGLEITTGGQRIHEYEELVTSLQNRGLEPEDFADYLQCFKYGMPPHGGFAIGLERLTKQLLGLPTVKLASLFPRDMNRLRP